LHGSFLWGVTKRERDGIVARGRRSRKARAA
jgi:hypothetical protein